MAFWSFPLMITFTEKVFLIIYFIIVLFTQWNGSSVIDACATSFIDTIHLFIW